MSQQNYDEQLIEAVQLRRTRVTQALLHRDERRRRIWSERAVTAAAGIVVAGIISAGCVGYGVVTKLLAEQRAKDAQVTAPRVQQPVPATTAPVPTTPGQGVR